MKKFLVATVFIFFIFLGVIFFNTFTLQEPKYEPIPNTEWLQSTEFEEHYKKLIEHLAQAIRIQTISYQDPKQIDKNEFQKFIQFLEKSFPRVHKNLKRTLFNFSLLYEWKGKNPELKPVILMGHYDVVPADPSEWKFPPFDGVLSEGYLFGRGAIDDKITVLGILQAAEFLLQQNFQPERTIYFSFGHDEEIGGFQGAKLIVEYLHQQNIQPEFVLDEGGAITVKIIPNIDTPVATIGIAEKGYLSLKLTTTGTSGHSSMPPKETSITKLITALHRLHENPFDYEFTEIQKTMFRFIGADFPFFQKMAIANLWLFEPIIISNLTTTNTGRASLQTTMATTILQSGIKENVIPEKAEAIINFRLLPGDTIAEVKKRVQEIIQDPTIQIEETPYSMEASPVSSVDSLGFTLIARSLKTINPEISIAPYLVLGATDARHFSKISNSIYRFLPVYLTEDELQGMHGINERISLESIKTALSFYALVIKNL
ncbi:MAG: M20 family peptidase [Leptospiraceae bacterium]|nr:M20 family peptidase [Leptospiraceae bacterium]MDW7975476.1 M20 family peptidase [Leptospiraceae bacterium]